MPMGHSLAWGCIANFRGKLVESSKLSLSWFNKAKICNAPLRGQDETSRERRQFGVNPGEYLTMYLGQIRSYPVKSTNY